MTVTNAYGEPVNGGGVTFTAPAGGPSITPAFYIVNIAKGAAGLRAVANSIAGGPYTVMASTTGADSVNFLLTNTP